MTGNNKIDMIPENVGTIHSLLAKEYHRIALAVVGHRRLEKADYERYMPQAAVEVVKCIQPEGTTAEQLLAWFHKQKADQMQKGQNHASKKALDAAEEKASMSKIGGGAVKFVRRFSSAEAAELIRQRQVTAEVQPIIDSMEIGETVEITFSTKDHLLTAVAMIGAMVKGSGWHKAIKPHKGRGGRHPRAYTSDMDLGRIVLRVSRLV